MTASEIKTELQQMETDVNVLHTVYAILLKRSMNPLLRDKLARRAIKSEEDIREGRIFSRDEVINLTN